MEKASAGLEKLGTHDGDTYDPFSDEAQEMLMERAAATIKRSSHMSQLPAMDAFISKSKTEKEFIIGDGSDSDEEEKIDTSSKVEDAIRKGSYDYVCPEGSNLNTENESSERGSKELKDKPLKSPSTLPTENSEMEEEKKAVSFQIPKHSFDRISGDWIETDEDQEQYHK